MARRFINNWSAALTAELASAGLSMSIDAGAAERLGTIGTDYYLLTLVARDPAGVETAWEIVKVTGRSAGVLTVVRGQEGTVANNWPVGSVVEARITAGDMAELWTAAHDGGGGGGGGIPEPTGTALNLRAAGAWRPLDSMLARLTPLPQVGNYLDNGFLWSSPTNNAFIPDQVKAAPWAPLRDVVIDELRIRVQTGSSGGYIRVGLYSADEMGWPNELLVTFGQILVSTSGDKWVSITPYTLRADRVYWLAFHSSVGATVEALREGMPSLGQGSAALTRFNMLQQSQPFSGGLPATWTYSDSDLVSGAVPVLRMRRAEV
ncbi:hypothetical protein [Pseudomonas sp. TUM22785]|uniref:hypothetical protein n=1 Tax=Pseudomonas sp. TUM22785 TaxID=3019098 RepID=UPI002305F0B3|nr:hypothetical protein [Pseudomonas sp. TUM22785]WCD79137.1 hypothetical protein PI990_24550 [Pseudomonas sp. TUM22785]